MFSFCRRSSAFTDSLRKMSTVSLQRLEGLPGRRNDVLTVGEADRCSKLLVYFGGDVQDLESVMEAHRDNRRYSEWSLERTASLLYRAQPGDSLVVVVRPARMERGSFSCFDNFVPSNSVGSPEHCDDHGALRHLSLLLHQLQSPPGPVCLVGFSKGVVVLNQLVRELSSQRKSDLTLHRLVWLDGGHNGGKDIWLTDRALLQTVVDLDIQVDVRVTPYQVSNPNRPWIGKEEKVFRNLLTRLGARVKRSLYYGEETASIENHFRVIESLLTDPL